MPSSFETLRFRDGALEMLDQRVLPDEQVYLRYDSADGVARAIRDMVVRGAPAIGCAAAFGVAVEGLRLKDEARADFDRSMSRAFDALAASRPTAVNLFWALERMKRTLNGVQGATSAAAADALVDEAQNLCREDVALNRAMGALGAVLLGDNARVLTHCNAGALATAGYGTALGVIRGAIEQGKKVAVLADETRPFLQGARLTAWELTRDGIDTTVITDNMSGALMLGGHIDLVVVGADRIAANGDVANKIGTYSVAVLAKEHGIPFYVAAPISTIDLATPDGSGIPIEERHAKEVTHMGPARLTPEAAKVRNPAFDVTPHKYVTAIITERGIARAPYDESLPNLVKSGSGAILRS